MNRRGLVLAAAMLAALLAVGAATPAAAASAQREPTPIVRQVGQLQLNDTTERKIEPMVLWTLVGIAAASALGGSLYLFKRRIGAFPRDPDWVAPISVMPAGENAESESDYPSPPADHH